MLHCSVLHVPIFILFTIVLGSGRLSNSEVCGKCNEIHDVVLDTTGMVALSTAGHGTGTCYRALDHNALQDVPGSHDTSLYCKEVAQSNSLVGAEPVDSSISWLFSNMVWLSMEQRWAVCRCIDLVSTV